MDAICRDFDGYGWKIGNGALHIKMSFTESYMMIRKSLGDMKMFGIKKFEKCGCFFLWQKEKTIVWAIALLSAHDNEGFLSEVLLSEYSSSVLYSQSEIRWKAHRFECLVKFSLSYFEFSNFGLSRYVQTLHKT